jgi:hypothetical protein
MIDDGFQVLRAFPDGKLSVCVSFFAHDVLDVCHLAMRAELVCLAGRNFEQLV